MATNLTTTTVDLPNGTRVVRFRWDGAGTVTFSKPPPPAGYKIGYWAVACINGGDSGSAGGNIYMPSPGGRDGGYVRAEFADPAIPSSVTVTVGAGGAATSSSDVTPGNQGEVSKFGSVLSGSSGVAADIDLNGTVRASALKPGRGGASGAVSSSTPATTAGTSLNIRSPSHSHTVSGSSTNSVAVQINGDGSHNHALSSVDYYSAGANGESALYAPGGVGAIPTAGIFGSSGASDATAGADGIADDLTLHPGSGGGGAARGAASGAGGVPGGAGGGAWNTPSGGTYSRGAGAGADGAVALWGFYIPELS